MDICRRKMDHSPLKVTQVHWNYRVWSLVYLRLHVSEP